MGLRNVKLLQKGGKFYEKKNFIISFNCNDAGHDAANDRICDGNRNE